MHLTTYNIYFFSDACSIGFDEYVIITGGRFSQNIVSHYNESGFSHYLPKLNFIRFGHGCGHYMNENFDLVK